MIFNLGSTECNVLVMNCVVRTQYEGFEPSTFRVRLIFPFFTCLYLFVLFGISFFFTCSVTVPWRNTVNWLFLASFQSCPINTPFFTCSITPLFSAMNKEGWLTTALWNGGMHDRASIICNKHFFFFFAHKKHMYKVLRGQNQDFCKLQSLQWIDCAVT